MTKEVKAVSSLYVTESSATIRLEANRCIVKYADGMQTEIPIETLEGITIIGRAQMTTQCAQECLKRGIPVSYFSTGGSYYGKLLSTGHVNTQRQRKQCELYESRFAIDLTRILIRAKLKNQIVVLKRYERSRIISVSDSLRMMHICREKLLLCRKISEMMGYEGQGAKAYFDGLSVLVEPEFAFQGRNKRPARDEFNSMLNLGYFVLRNEIYGKIEEKGLNPYFGFMHRDKERHPTLVSDMMEEWRAVIVDATVMSMINGHEIQKEDFATDMDEPGCFLTKSGMKKFLPKLEKKLQAQMKYLSYVDYDVSFRQGMALQLNRLVKAIESRDASIYRPIEIR